MLFFCSYVFSKAKNQLFRMVALVHILEELVLYVKMIPSNIKEFPKRIAEYLARVNISLVIGRESVRGGTHIMKHLISTKLLLAGYDPVPNHRNQFSRLDPSEISTAESAERKRTKKAISVYKRILTTPGKMVTLSMISISKAANKATWDPIVEELQEQGLGAATQKVLSFDLAHSKLSDDQTSSKGKRVSTKKSSVFIKKQFDGEWSEEEQNDFIAALAKHGVNLEEYEKAYYQTNVASSLTSSRDSSRDSSISSISRQSNSSRQSDNSSLDVSSNVRNGESFSEEDIEQTKRRNRSVTSSNEVNDPTSLKKTLLNELDRPQQDSGE